MSMGSCMREGRTICAPMDRAREERLTLWVERSAGERQSRAEREDIDELHPCNIAILRGDIGDVTACGTVLEGGCAWQMPSTKADNERS